MSMAASADRASAWRQLAPAAAAGLALLAMMALYLGGGRALYMRILSVWEVRPFQFPFLDTDTVLSALRCLRQGVDVQAINPCDPLGRVFDYSPLWLAGAVLPVTTGWTAPVGLAFDGLFLLSLLLLPPGRGWLETGLIAAGALSTAAVYAVERGNNDLIVFALTAAAAALVASGRRWRLAGYGAAFLAGLLKYYPMAVMAVALRERPKLFLILTLLACLGLGLFVVVDGHALGRALRLIPAGSAFSDMFGAKTLPLGLRQLGWLPRHKTEPLRWALAIAAALTGLLLGARSALRADLARLTEAERVFLMAGALVVLGCYLTAQNLGYRAVLLLLMLPGLTALRHESGRWPYGLAAAGVLVLLWSEGWRHWLDLALGAVFVPLAPTPAQVVGWALREAAWWGLVSLLFALLAALLPRQGTGRVVLAWLAAVPGRRR